MKNTTYVTKKAMEAIMKANTPKEKYFDKFCEELKKSGVDENKHDYSDLFEKALMEEGLV